MFVDGTELQIDAAVERYVSREMVRQFQALFFLLNIDSQYWESE